LVKSVGCGGDPWKVFFSKLESAGRLRGAISSINTAHVEAPLANLSLSTANTVMSNGQQETLAANGGPHKQKNVQFGRPASSTYPALDPNRNSQITRIQKSLYNANQGVVRNTF
jgi:hypothetical protein